MKTVNNWLITWTAGLLRHPRLFIMIPILSGFLLSYPALYDFTLGPLNGSLLTIFDDCILPDGSRIAFRDPDFGGLLSQNLSEFTISKVSFTGSNTLKYESLKELHEWVQNIPEQSIALTPLSYLPDLIFAKAYGVDEQRKIERCILKILNHDLPKKLVSMFLDNFGKQNYVINLASILNLFLFQKKNALELPGWYGKSLKIIPQYLPLVANADSDFISYLTLVSGKNATLNWLVRILGLAQLLVIVVSLVRVYLSVCNNHKIRSNVGLLIGWLNSIFISTFSSLAIFSKYFPSSTWPDLSDPITLIMFGYYLLTVLILSSRNLFRTVNDLAGDSTFGEPQSLHKRLIKFYLGFNNSVENSEGVYHISSFIRRTLRLDSYCHMSPIPNTTIILLINISGLSVTMGICVLIFRLFLDNLAWSLFCQASNKCLQLTIVTLIIDHLLQLTYMVAIIVIDLNRIDLADVLAKVTDDDLDFSNLHEVNPFSAKLLASKGDTRFSWKHRLGTYLLKVSPHSPKSLWLKVLPLLCMCISATIATQTHMAERYLLKKSFGIANQSTTISNGNDTLYFVELLAVIILILAISEITFTLTFSKRQKENVESVILSDKNEMSVSDLSNIDSTRKFESITLDQHNASDKLRLFANPKSPFLVTTDLGHHVSLWSPLSKDTDDIVEDISALFESNKEMANRCEFWPINHVEISNEGDYVVLINNRNCRIKCFSRKLQKYTWEISLTSELAQQKDKMKPVLCFFRKKTVAGFFARELLLRRKKLSGGSKRNSVASLSSMHGNFPPPFVNQNVKDLPPSKDGMVREYDESFNRDQFVMILETGEMITIACDSVKIKVYNLLTELFLDEPSSLQLRIISLKFLTTARVNDRVICTISNDQIVVGSAVNNVWRFSKLKTNKFFTNSQVAFAPPSMIRGTWVPLDNIGSSRNFNNQRESLTMPRFGAFSSMNESTIVTIDFVGMFVRVKELQAELIDIQTGTVLRLFHIGSFKPGSFRVSHSEPTHCKFCGCVSFETMSLIYEDFYEKTLIVHTFKLENRKSRNNICLRVERDPLEIRCLGFDAVVETQYWFDDIEMWELTDMNVIMGIKKALQADELLRTSKKHGSGSEMSSESIGLTSLRNRKRPTHTGKIKESLQPLSDKWQGFLITVLDGKLLDYKIPMEELYEKKSYCMRPNLIVKFGFKAVAIAFGHVVKIIYLGNDKLIENDLYYSGSASTIKPLLVAGGESTKPLNELLFINKRRKMIERKIAKLNDSTS